MSDLTAPYDLLTAEVYDDARAREVLAERRALCLPPEGRLAGAYGTWHVGACAVHVNPFGLAGVRISAFLAARVPQALLDIAAGKRAPLYAMTLPLPRPVTVYLRWRALQWGSPNEIHVDFVEAVEVYDARGSIVEWLAANPPVTIELE